MVRGVRFTLMGACVGTCALVCLCACTGGAPSAPGSATQGATDAGGGDGASPATPGTSGAGGDAGPQAPSTQDAGPGGDAGVVAKRDPRKWPFASDSIWNTPIGSGASFVPAELNPEPLDPPSSKPGESWAPMPQIDRERIVLHPEAPLMNVGYSDAAWSNKSRCASTGKPPKYSGLPIQVHVPSSYVVPSTRDNNCAVFLQPDGHTLIELQPFTRCAAGGDGTALVVFDGHPIDLYADGMYGSHGGSSLSGIGGSLRVGELLTEGPRHAIKINVDSVTEFGDCSKSDESCRTSVQDACCYRWPAYASDSGAEADYGSSNKGKTKAMKMGTLLAIPSSTSLASLGFESQPGNMLAWTLQNYGGYIVDSTGGAAFGISAEDGPDGSFDDTFKAKWGYPFESRVNDGSKGDPHAAFVRDMQRIVKALRVVANNGPNAIGGGGTPLQPLAPPLDKAP